MLNVSQMLQQSRINTKSVYRAVEDVRTTLQRNAKVCNNATNLLQDVFDLTEYFDNDIRAILTVQSLVQATVERKCEVDNIVEMLKQAKDKVDTFMTNSLNSFMFVERESIVAGSKPEEDVQDVVEGLSKVAVNKDGKIKKGGKNKLAEEMFSLFRIDHPGYPQKTGDKKADQAFDRPFNALFVDSLMTKLQMSKAGANTYLNNLKKAVK